jgi:hypothetical protein
VRYRLSHIWMVIDTHTHTYTHTNSTCAAPQNNNTRVHRSCCFPSTREHSSYLLLHGNCYYCILIIVIIHITIFIQQLVVLTPPFMFKRVERNDIRMRTRFFESGFQQTLRMRVALKRNINVTKMLHETCSFQVRFDSLRFLLF